MRVIFFAVVLANVAMLAWGQGFFGTPPSERGREPHFLTERNQQAVTVGPPMGATSNEAAPSAPARPAQQARPASPTAKR